MTLALAFKLQAQLGLFQYFNALQSEVQCIFWLSAHCFYNAGKLLLKKDEQAKKKNLKVQHYTHCLFRCWKRWDKNHLDTHDISQQVAKIYKEQKSITLRDKQGVTSICRDEESPNIS